MVYGQKCQIFDLRSVQFLICWLIQQVSSSLHFCLLFIEPKLTITSMNNLSNSTLVCYSFGQPLPQRSMMDGDYYDPNRSPYHTGKLYVDPNKPVKYCAVCADNAMVSYRTQPLVEHTLPLSRCCSDDELIMYSLSLLFSIISMVQSHVTPVE